MTYPMSSAIFRIIKIFFKEIFVVVRLFLFRSGLVNTIMSVEGNLVRTAEAANEEERKSCNFVKNGKVYILGDFDDSISRYVIPDLADMIAEGAGQKDTMIPIYINSWGGEADKLESILSLLSIANRNGIKIVTYNIGVAYSCGSMLAAAGDYRFMSKSARNMMHLGEIGSLSRTYEQLKRNSRDVKDFFDETVRFYRDHSKMTEKKIREILNDDMYWMGAKECLRLGLCDEII